METLGPAALAAKLGVSRQTIYEYERAGKLPQRVNGGWFLKEAKKFLADNLGNKRGGMPRTGERSDAQAAAAKAQCSPSKGPQVVPPDQGELDLESPDSRSKSELEKRLLIERAEKMRLDNEEKRGVLVNRADVESATESRFRADAEALLSWPSSVSAEMAAELGIQERILFPILNRFIRAFMKDRSNVGVAA